MCFSVGRVRHQTPLASLGILSESITECQTCRDHVIITRLAYIGLLNCGNSLVKSDVSLAPLSSVRVLELLESEDEPQGTGTWDGRGTGSVNNKIYYPSAHPGEGADGDRCSLELAVRYGETDFWGIRKRMEA